MTGFPPTGNVDSFDHALRLGQVGRLAGQKRILAFQPQSVRATPPYLDGASQTARSSAASAALASALISRSSGTRLWRSSLIPDRCARHGLFRPSCPASCPSGEDETSFQRRSGDRPCRSPYWHTGCPHSRTCPAKAARATDRHPRPGMLMATGMRQASASARSSPVAPEAITPPPARITGRSAPAIHCASVSIFSAGTNGTTSVALAMAKASPFNVPRWMFIGRSTSTGPRRPERASTKACSITFGQIPDVPDLERGLGDRSHQVDRVHFLEAALPDRKAAAHVARTHLAGDHDQRDIVIIGIGDRRDGICDARPRGHHEHRGLAGHARITQRGIAGALLRARTDDLDLRALLDAVQNRRNRAAWKNEHPADVMAQESLQHQIGAFARACRRMKIEIG